MSSLGVLNSTSKNIPAQKTHGSHELLNLDADHCSAHEAWSTIADIAEVLTPKSKSRDEFLAECKSGAFDGVSVVFRTFDSFAVTGRIDDEFLDAMPSSLSFMCHNGM